MSATVQDILDKIDLLEIDRSNIRRAIIAKDVYVPTDVTISTYGDYIRMINPDIELEYVYTYQYYHHNLDDSFLGYHRQTALSLQLQLFPFRPIETPNPNLHNLQKVINV